MSIGALGFGGIGAATPLAQSSGSDVERTQQENIGTARRNAG